MKKKKIIEIIKEVIKTSTLDGTDKSLFTDVEKAQIWANSWIEEPLKEALRMLAQK
jgi:hypothetical protein